MQSLITLITVCCSLGFMVAQTTISEGEVTGIWELSGSPYYIEGDVEIPIDSALEIQSGVQVVFKGHYKINVQGCLLARGNALDSIKFTVVDTAGFYNTQVEAGGWNGIRFVNTPENQDTSKFSFCTFEYGKAVGNSMPVRAGGALKIEKFHKVVITHSIFRNNLAGGGGFSEGGAIFLFEADVVLSNNLIFNNRAQIGGGIRILHSNPLLQGNVIRNNFADEGGGISMFGSSPILNGDLFEENTAVNLGGGIFALENTDPIQLKEVEFKKNSANWGGGLGLGNCHLDFQNCTFTENKVQWLGAAFAADYCNILVSESTFSRDSSLDSGGAIHLDHSDIIVSESELTQNGAINGGAINSIYSKIELENCNMEENFASNEGGVLKIYNSDLVVKNCIMVQNASENRGGVLVYDADTSQYQNNYNLQILNTLINQNSARVGSGGLIIRKTEALSVDVQVELDQVVITENIADVNSAAQLVNLKNLYIGNCRIADNVAQIRTSGLSVSSCTGIIENSVFAGNMSQGGTAACAIGNASSIHLMNNLFANNSSGLAAAFSLRGGARSSVTNCIFWNNTQKQIALISPSDSLSCRLTIDYSLVQDGLDSVQKDMFSEIHWGEHNIISNPAFLDETVQDYHLSDGSPVIGKGIETIELEDTTLTTAGSDFDGNPRPNPDGSNPDMGPFESPLGFSTSTVKKEDIVNEIKIYPNPVNDYVKVNLFLNQSAQLYIQIFSLDGKMVREWKVSKNSGKEIKVNYSIRQLPAGMYLMKLIIGNQILTRKLVVV